MRAETQGAVCHKFSTVRPLEITPPLLTPGERCTVALAAGYTFPAGLPQVVETDNVYNALKTAQPPQKGQPSAGAAYFSQLLSCAQIRPIRLGRPRDSAGM